MISLVARKSFASRSTVTYKLHASQLHTPFRVTWRSDEVSNTDVTQNTTRDVAKYIGWIFWL